MDSSNSTANQSDAFLYPTTDRLTSRTWLFRLLHALCGRQSLTDLNILDEEVTTSTDLNILSTTGSSSNDFNSIQSYRYRYDVFISFRGVDTRNTFVDHLYAHLTRKGIFTFKDDTQLQQGESISPQLRQAIQHSRVSIVVFSEEYADSTWCLSEMSFIAECLAQLKQIVLPVFYHVDPSQVRKQNGEYEEAFVVHTEIFKHDDPHMVDRWKRAMTCLAGLAGWDTTLANVLYDTISHHYQFDACCFIEDVSKIYRDGGAIAVQKRILHQTIKENNMEGYSPSEISGIITNRLYKLKLLLVLDNVNQSLQLQELHINPIALCAGSRIIITTRDCWMSIFSKNMELIYIVYEAELMDDNDAHELLCRKAFRSDYYSSSDYAELIPKVLTYTQGLPLAIRVMGSFLYKRNSQQWNATLDGMENNPDSGIMKVLKSSFEGLQPREREIFLHIACFFDGERKDYVRRILDACELHPDIGISLIAEKLFITIRNQEIHMHKMLQELGKQIVREQHPENPREWSRLWLFRDFYHAMITKSQLPNLKRIDLSNSKNLKTTPCFDGILNLERLDLTGCINLSHVDPSIGLLSKLVFLSLQNYSSLVNLDFGNAAELWALKVLRLSDCTKLENTPNFSGLVFLQYLDMDRCASLFMINESIGDLAQLRFLSLRDCTHLVGIPDSFNKMTSLITLNLRGCSKFTKLGCTTTSPLQLQSLIYLDLSFCSISLMPDSIGELICLERLNLQGNNFTSLPSTLSWLRNLSYLNLSHCHKLQSLPLLPTESGPSDSVGRYFKTTSGSRDHRSGFYIFDSPNCMKFVSPSRNHECLYWFPFGWVLRLIKEPLHFRFGFDVVLPWHCETNGSRGHRAIPKTLTRSWSDKVSKLFHHRFKGGSIVRINNSVVNDGWVGFLFFVTFELNNHHVPSSSPHQSHSLPPLPHPFYLSFESEYTEERFDMPLDLERNTVDGKNYLWTIYISREHCHFVETGAQITFKARQGLIIKEWGLRVKTKKDTEGSKMGMSVHFPLQIIDNAAEESTSVNNNFETKIQLPYNWLVSNEDSIENDKTKGKETDLFNPGLFTERPQ
nr:nodulation protein [Melilotus officinalis]